MIVCFKMHKNTLKLHIHAKQNVLSSMMGGCVSSREFDVETDGRRFRLRRVIATGGFSQIYLAEDVETGNKFAVKKVVCHGDSEALRAKREIDLLLRFGNFPYILPLVAVAEDRPSPDPSLLTFCMVFPFCRLGSLQDELTQRRQSQSYMGRRRIVFLFRQICSAIEFLHAANPPVAHRDLKPANLMYRDEKRLQLIDFGSATECPLRIGDSRESRRMLDEAAELCTMPYRAPELFVCEVGAEIGPAVDIWSLGCVLYSLCYFASPYDEVHERGDSVALAVQSAKLNFNKSAPFDEELASLISSMIKLRPEERPNIKEIRRRAEEMRL